ncbi:MAG: hypothetical protein ACODAE_09480 [Gemmatimonadota bacterium]
MRRRRLTARLVPMLVLAPWLAGAEARAQTTTVDEGVFELTLDGRRIGTETFAIQRRGRGDAVTTTARARITLDSGAVARQITTSLELDGPALRPSLYQIDIRGPQREQIVGRLAGRRFSARIISDDGERMREYLADAGAVIVDDGVAHHHYFLALRADEGARVPVIIPRQSRQATARISVDGVESITIGGRSIRARHLVIAIDGGSTRHLWVDDDDRMLRLTVPATGLVALRSARPR